jgi:quinol monooxygenase YgiN
MEMGMLEQVVRLAINMMVNENQLEAFQSIAKSMTEACKAEPGTIGYEWFADRDGKRFRLMETYVDANAVVAHFQGSVVQEWLPKLAVHCTVEGVELYGNPGPKGTELALGLGAVIFPYRLGLDR